ncbi:hypothetical protein G9G39_03830 [Cronobacter sp. EKM101R]|uniref:hypothetical protein n=1 Tax=Cronobacter TaxID=413496 RepID=UPI0013EA1129|nr:MULTISPECIES: hypothetical protein [Cronobacter]KAF6596208.1 hypothetical protein G9G39_03830 [Cronobacter sp. EKM101R]KAF6599035.1 hypothetical protein G9G38_03475 [Cronobacter sp. EKM102R]MDK1204200.1 hypothetical protein [Cronobacter turicensis]MDK1214257.1 hypothetical protein [Cronobacter turicensis]MDK1233305.1 hypothetical protein [Cronobacter turicensis]
MAFTRELYKLGFEISPVILCGGVAQSIPGGMLPVVALTQSASFVTGLLGGAMELTDLDKYFCHWRVAQGATLVEYDIGRYPFANQAVAANALLAQPLRVPMLMDAPVNDNTGAMTKLVTLSALQAVTQAHANLGGTYIVATPAVIYNNCILKSVRDVTGSNEPLPQRQWLWDFEQPLIAETGAQQAINSYLSKIDNGDKAVDTSWTNTLSALGNASIGSSVSGAIIGLIGKLSGDFGL